MKNIIIIKGLSNKENPTIGIIKNEINKNIAVKNNKKNIFNFS
jgi:hypothetical protein